MANGRCRLHGGLSTGPKTPEGLERSRKARWKHGRYSAKAKRLRRRSRARRKWLKEFFNVVGSHDSLCALLFEIEEQMARGDTRDLQPKCILALTMLNHSEVVIALGKLLYNVEWEKPRAHRVTEAKIRAMLEAGIQLSSAPLCPQANEAGFRKTLTQERSR